MIRARALLIGVIAAILCGVAACALFSSAQGRSPQLTPTAPPTSSAPTPPPTTAPHSTPPTSAKPTPRPTPRPTPIAEVTATVKRFHRVLDSLSHEPVSKPYTQLLTVTRGEAFQVWQTAIVEGYGNGWRQKGSTKVLSVDQGPLSANGRQVRVDTCVDVSQVDVVDRDGKSVVAKGRPDRAAATLVLVLEKDRWYITQDRDGKHKC